MGRYVFTSDSTVEIFGRSNVVGEIHGETQDVSGEGTLEVRDGTITLDPAPAGYVEVPIEALSSGKKLQDFEMRRRTEAKKYPIIRAELREVSGGPDRYSVRIALTFHGVTREFTDEATATVQDGLLMVEGEHTFDIQDFGMKAPKILNLQVFPEVRVVARLVATQA
jgi:polyisoprenoid-binding protein YceI